MASPTPKHPKKFHFAMFPWFAFGHMTPFLHLSNQLSERGHSVSFLLPKAAQPEIEKLSLHPNLIHFFPLDCPLENLVPPAAAETASASNLPVNIPPNYAAAHDRIRDQMEAILRLVKPNFVFYDFGFWIPNLGRSLGFKSIHYSVVCAASNALMFGPSLEMHINSASLLADLIFEMPPGYPLPKVQLRKREACEGSALIMHETGSGLTLYERVTKSMKECDAIAIRTCREIEGPFCDYISQQYNKTVLLSGHVLPETTTPPQEKLGEPWAEWLSKFKPNSVVFCALGSHIVLDKDQFQELLLGFELSRLPFLVALKPPKGCTTIEEALPEGFKERVEGRGWVDGGWVPQPAILGHPSVGCFVSHCGFGSMWESLLSKCQIVLFPHLPDQILDARLLVEELKVAVEVEKDIESGWLSKDSLCKAIKSVMDEENKMGYELRSNHGKYREILSSKNFQSAYTDGLIQNLQDLMD